MTPTPKPDAPRCQTCGAPFPPEADPRRVTCSNACRQRAYRARQKAHMLAVRAALEDARAHLGAPRAV